MPFSFFPHCLTEWSGLGCQVPQVWHEDTLWPDCYMLSNLDAYSDCWLHSIPVIPFYTETVLIFSLRTSVSIPHFTHKQTKLKKYYYYGNTQGKFIGLKVVLKITHRNKTALFTTIYILLRVRATVDLKTVKRVLLCWKQHFRHWIVLL